MIVALAENARIPVDNPATHLELTMVHEAMVLEYSGRHLAMIEWAAALKLVLYLSLIACLFLPFGMGDLDRDPAAMAIGLAVYLAKLVGLGMAGRRWSRWRSPRCGCSASADLLGGAFVSGLARHAAAVRVEGLDRAPCANVGTGSAATSCSTQESSLSRRIRLRATRPR